MHYFPTQLIGKITRTDYQKILNDFAYGTDDGKDHAQASVQQFNVQVRKCVRDAVQDGGLEFDFTPLADQKALMNVPNIFDEDDMQELLNVRMDSWLHSDH